MLHKISHLCDKIDAIKYDADILREMKYGPKKARTETINNMIEEIQFQCFLIANDKDNYPTGK